MRNGPIAVPGVAGSVSVDSSFWSGKQTVLVDDQPVPSTGRRTFMLPTPDGGTTQAKVGRSSLINPFPTLEVGGVKHPTGPEVPVGLRVLLILPVVLVALGGLIGAVIAIGSILLNHNLLRSDRPTRSKAMLMTLVVVAAFVVWIALAALIVR